MEINVLFVIILLGGWAFGKITEKVKLPAVLGMVIFGIICSALLKSYTPDMFWQTAPFLKSFALIVILLRAGLGISRATLAKAGISAVLMGFVPCIIEGTALTFAFRFIFGFDYIISGLTAFLLAAVSPAVVVPSMLELKSRGLGEKNEVPTIVLAGASLDDVFAIAQPHASVMMNLVPDNPRRTFNYEGSAKAQ